MSAVNQTLLLIIFAGLISCSDHVDQRIMETQNISDTVTIKTLEQILDAFNRHDLDAIMEFFAEDCTFELPKGPDPWGQRFVGKQRVREGLATRFKGIPDVHYGDGSH